MTGPLDNGKALAASHLAAIRREFEKEDLPEDIKISALEVIGRLDELFSLGRQQKRTVELMVGSLPVVDHIDPKLRALVDLA